MPNTKKILDISKESGYKIIEKSQPSNKKKRRSFYFVLGKVSELGFILAFPLVSGVFVGRWVDTRLKTDPIFTLVGILVGVVFSFGTLYQTVKDFS